MKRAEDQVSTQVTGFVYNDVVLAVRPARGNQWYKQEQRPGAAMASTPRPKTTVTQTARKTPSTRKTSRTRSVSPQLAEAQRLLTERHREQASLLGQVVSQRHLVKDDIRNRTEQITETVLGHSRAMKSANFTSTTAADLQRMAELYDVLFFDSRLLSLARLHGLSFRWSSRMTSAGGKTIRSVHRTRGRRGSRTSYEIALSATLLFQTFGDLERPIRVTGHTCANRIEAMQRILEHELIHLAEMLVWEDSNCAAGRFQTIAHRMFGHTEHKHDLVTQHERAAKKYNIRIGSMVSFQHEGQMYIGKVNRITRRATILVADPQGQKYNDGKSYRKFYVPLSHLRTLA